MSRKPESFPLKQQIAAMANFAALPSQLQLRNAETVYTGSPYLSKGESIASSSVRVAMKSGSKLLMVLTDTGRTATLVAKYRPSIPIYALVIPQLTTDNIQWKLQGRSVARQLNLIRGVTPVLADVGAGSKEVLEGVIRKCIDGGVIKAGDGIVVVERLRTDFAIQVIHAPGGEAGTLGVDDHALEDNMASKAAVEGKIPTRPAIGSLRTLTDLHMRQVR